jgi:hypothetical protein
MEAEMNDVNMEESRVPKRILNYKLGGQFSKVSEKMNRQRKFLMGG